MKDQKYYIKQREAILNDKHRQDLFKQLFDLYAKSLPIILKKKNGDIICRYTDEVEQSADNIRKLIQLRDDEIFNSFA